MASLMKDDDTDLFGQQMAAYLRRLPTKPRELAKLKMQSTYTKHGDIPQIMFHEHKIFLAFMSQIVIKYGKKEPDEAQASTSFQDSGLEEDGGITERAEPGCSSREQFLAEVSETPQEEDD